ncbi:MAG: hypothetical protein ACOX87_05480 [Chloroflexota bacterium]
MSEAGSRTRSLVVVLACVGGAKLFVTAIMAIAGLLYSQAEIDSQYGGSGVALLQAGWERLLLGVWQREDAIWYQKIAEVGYSTQDMTQEFFPLFPMSMRLVTWITGLHPVSAGMIISELSILLALYLLHRLILPGFGARTADRTVLYISIFPTAFFLHGPFTESLALALAVLAFYLMRSGRWYASAVAGFLAGLSRPQGLLLGPALAMEQISGGKPLGQWRSFHWTRPDLARASILLLAPVAGFGTFIMLVDTAWRRPGEFSGIGPGHGVPAPPGAALLFALQNFATGTIYPIELFNFIVALAFLPLIVLVALRLGAGYAVYSALFFAAPLSRYLPGFALMSFSRYMLLLFPCFIVLALLGRRRWVHLAVIFLFLWWLVVWSFKFPTGYFVG